MTGPKLPRPPSVPRPWLHEKEEKLQKAFHDTLPPGAKARITDHELKTSSDLQAMANAVTAFQIDTNKQHAQLVAQVSAVDERVIGLTAAWTKWRWTRHPVARLLTMIVGSAIGAYAALKGLK